MCCSSRQDFFSLAWSTVLMSRGGGASAQHCSILAAGGKRGLVKLIHPRNNVAYGEFRASRKSLSVVRFNHHQGNFLFSESLVIKQPTLWGLIVWQPPTSNIRQIKGFFYSFGPDQPLILKQISDDSDTFSLAAGSYDNKIMMWDIGGVDSQYNYKVVWVFLLASHFLYLDCNFNISHFCLGKKHIIYILCIIL